MFKETKEGQTHYENDGCGEPAHNSLGMRSWKLCLNKHLMHGVGDDVCLNCEEKFVFDLTEEIYAVIYDKLVEILAKAESMETAREVRHLIKDYILGERKENHEKITYKNKTTGYLLL